MRTQKPRVLLYSTHFDFPFWGGSEKFWYGVLLDQRMLRRFACKVLLGDSPLMREKVERLKAQGVEVQFYSESRGSLQNRIVRRVRRMIPGSDPGDERYPWLMREISDYEPALVWYNLSTANDALFLEHAAKACRGKGIPYWLVVQHAHENFFLPEAGQIERCAEVLEGARRIFCVSKRNRMALERMIGRHLNNVSMTVNGLSTQFLEQAFTAARSHPVRVTGQARFVNVARFDPPFKGQHLLLEVFSSSVWKGREWLLVLQGGGGLFSLLRRLIDYYGLTQDRVRLVDYDPEVLSVLTDSDVFLMPSLSEGAPFALTEAMACGRPALGTPVGGIPELILEDKTGWISRSTEVTDIADALERAWSARPMWPVFGERAQSIVKASYNQEIAIANLLMALEADIKTL